MGGSHQHPKTAAGNTTRSSTASSSRASAATLDVESVIGTTIDRYQVRRLLGEGGMGRVYLARDITLGRSVALKLVTGSVPECFLDEARAVAKLNHPNIVHLYDAREYRNGVYLALEYVDGETLRDRIRGRRIGLDEALRHALAIADALAHAHAAGVYHCDLKPSNVMVGRDGRVRVVDFGIARTDEAGAPGGGTPDWMAPEQWSQGSIDESVDIWALGIMVTQLLTGRHPLGDEPTQRRRAARDADRVVTIDLDRCDVPWMIVDLIARSLEHAPTRRPRAREWHRVLEDVISGRSDTITEDGPYPGLAAFDEPRAGFYFGREREIDEFVERLRDSPHLPIVGPSGAGKSSFLHAGVIPRLRAQGRWTVIAFRPGPDPVGALVRHLLDAMTTDSGTLPLEIKARVQQVRAELLEAPTRLAARLATLAAEHSSRILLAVDQLEEAFTQGTSELAPAKFLQMVLAAADDPADPVRIVFTVRDDFVGKIGGLRSLFVMRKLGVDELRRTVTGPLARYRYEFDDLAIVDDLIAEVGNAEVTDLPLLQFACRTLWDGRDVTARRLRRVTYEEMGGVAGALARHAERALGELSSDELRTARQLLLLLVSGTTRRSVPRDQLVLAVGRQANAVLDRLWSARLLVQRGQMDSESPIVEIAHESLLQTWSQLARWVDESRDERRLLQELEDATSLWERRGCRPQETWSHEDIVAARHRALQLGVALPARVQGFLTAGDQRHRALQRRRRLRYGIALAIVAAVSMPVSILIGRYIAREQAIRANAGTVEIALAPFDWIDGAPRAVDVDQLPGLSWALHAIKMGNPHEAGEPVPPQLVNILADNSTGTRRIWRIRAPGGMVFLKVDGRGRAGQRCAPSWIRIQAFPGYAGNTAPQSWSIDVPTCQATHADMILIEAGPFFYGGAGDPPTSLFGQRDYSEPERELTLPRYWLDRTEVSNARFAPFARLEGITGYRAQLYENDSVHEHDRDADYPATDIDIYVASAFCRYMGKKLPTDLEWMKAARGGRSIGGVVNPFPRRQFPWGPEASSTCVNQLGEDDGSKWTAPVNSYACGAGPYGHLNLVGNVDEWISLDSPLPTPSKLAVIRGGSARSPANLLHASTIFVNHRNPSQFDYSIGMRCSAHD